MIMQCENCGKSGATIHLTQIVNNEMTTHHLCDACAVEKGLDTGLGTGSDAPLADFLAQMGKETVGAGGGSSEACPSCGLTLPEFRRTGRLGCPHCYVHFEQHLKTLLRRLHGGVQHVGKVYLPPDSDDANRVSRTMGLRRSLQRAIEAEDFERAAELRDQLRALETPES